MRYLPFYAAIVIALLTAPAGAELSSADLPELAGADTFLTLDADTGLEWLDLTLTTSVSFTSITSGAALSNGGPLDGLNPLTGIGFGSPFRHATSDEVRTLFVNAGIPDINLELYSVAAFGPVLSLQVLMGSVPNGPSEFIQGFVADSPVGLPDVRWLPTLQTCANSLFDTSCQPGGSFSIGRNGVTEDTTQATSANHAIGHFLVRDANAKPRTVPTLSKWGLYLLVALFIGAGAWRLLPTRRG